MEAYVGRAPGRQMGRNAALSRFGVRASRPLRGASQCRTVREREDIAYGQAILRIDLAKLVPIGDLKNTSTRQDRSWSHRRSCGINPGVGIRTVQRTGCLCAAYRVRDFSRGWRTDGIPTHARYCLPRGTGPHRGTSPVYIDSWWSEHFGVSLDYSSLVEGAAPDHRGPASPPAEGYRTHARRRGCGVQGSNAGPPSPCRPRGGWIYQGHPDYENFDRLIETALRSSGSKSK